MVIIIHILPHCGLVMAYGDIELSQHWFSDLLPDGTKPLPEPVCD